MLKSLTNSTNNLFEIQKCQRKPRANYRNLTLQLDTFTMPSSRPTTANTSSMLANDWTSSPESSPRTTRLIAAKTTRPAPDRLTAVISLFEDRHSSQLYSRQMSAIEFACKQYGSGFVSHIDVFYLLKIISLCHERKSILQIR